MIFFFVMVFFYYTTIFHLFSKCLFEPRLSFGFVLIECFLSLNRWRTTWTSNVVIKYIG